LTYEMGSTDKVVEYINECKDMGIEVRPPDINESFTDFTVIYEQTSGGKKGSGLIRFGLAAVKGVGEKAVNQVIAARREVGRFKSLYHFCETVDLRAANKQVIEALIKAGAFDQLGASRAQMVAGLEKAMQIGAQTQADKNSGQMNLFGFGPFGLGKFGGVEDLERDHERLPDVPAWSEMQMLAYEKDVLGFYVTSNPLSRHAETIQVYSTTNSSHLGTYRQGHEIVIGGMVTKIRYSVTKNGRNAGSKMAVFTLEDLQGNVDVVMFADDLARYGDKLAVDRIIFVRGRVDFRRELPNIIASELVGLEQASEKIAARVKINLDAEDVTEEKIAMIKTICTRHKGKSPVYVTLRTDKGTIRAVAANSLKVRPDVDFCKKMEQLIGPANFELTR